MGRCYSIQTVSRVRAVTFRKSCLSAGDSRFPGFWRAVVNLGAIHFTCSLPAARLFFTLFHLDLTTLFTTDLSTFSCPPEAPCEDLQQVQVPVDGLSSCHCRALASNVPRRLQPPSMPQLMATTTMSRTLCSALGLLKTMALARSEVLPWDPPNSGGSWVSLLALSCLVVSLLV